MKQEKLIMILGPTKTVDKNYKFHDRNRIPGNIKGENSKEPSGPNLRCEICDFCDVVGSSYLDTTGYKDQETKKSGDGQKTPTRVTLRYDGRAICDLCWAEARKTKLELQDAAGEFRTFINEIEQEVLTAQKYRNTLGREVNSRPPDHAYYENGQLIKVYKPTHPKLRSKLTEEEKEAWRIEYSKSLDC